MIDSGGYGQAPERCCRVPSWAPLLGTHAARALCSVPEGSPMSKRMIFRVGAWPHTGI